MTHLHEKNVHLYDDPSNGVETQQLTIQDTEEEEEDSQAEQIDLNNKKKPTSYFGAPSKYLEQVRNINLPWLEDYQAWMTGLTRDHLPFGLYKIDGIKRDPTLPDDCISKEERQCYYIDLFFQMRLYSAKKKRLKRSSSDALISAWNVFISRYSCDSVQWKARLDTFRANFIRHTSTGIKMEVHQLCMEQKVPCAVTVKQNCPMCYSDSPKLSGDARKSKVIIKSKDLLSKITELDKRCGEKQDDEKISERNSRVDALEEEVEALTLMVLELRTRFKNVCTMMTTAQNET